MEEGRLQHCVYFKPDRLLRVHSGWSSALCGSLTFWIMGLGAARRRSFLTTVLPSSPLLSEG